MNLLVTRPPLDAIDLTACLTARGHSVQLEPLLSVQPRHDAALVLDGVSALLFTSTNGVRAFCAVDARRDLPVYAVGDRTAHEAHEAGFGDVRSANGNVDSLTTMIGQACQPSDGRLLHITGTVTAGDLANRLRRLGFEVDSAVLYEAIEARALSEKTRNDLKAAKLDGVLLFSPRTARHWMNLVVEAGLLQFTRHLDAWCLSEAVAVALASGEYRSVRIAEQPTQASLLHALDKEMK